eukprot:TRINITY_DN100511_c0_g1_i1.p1 TRINITY_DN100511_c0_g1~~TRINITY_DN100511_c0_g1_i1.p1  ORF type:complete len:244 (-),score=46.20 TRINITY_DN100511_c0_g1_i1:132-863(-)
MGLLARLVVYLQHDAEYEERVDDFMERHCHLFQCNGGLQTEQSLEAYAIFQEYERMVEELLLGFCSVEGLASGHDLLSRLQTELKGKPLSNLRGGYIKSLLQACSYEGFLATILEYGGVSKTRCSCTCAEPSISSSASTEVSAPPSPPPPPPLPQAHEETGCVAWTSEETSALADAGVLPPPPSAGQAVWGWWPDPNLDSGGQWLPAFLQSLAAEDGPGVVVCWQHDGSLHTLPVEHVHELAA